MQDFKGAKLGIALLGAGLFSSGCVSVLPEASPPKSLVRMPLDVSESVSAQTLNKSVSVELPSISGALSGADILTTDDLEMKFLTGVKWADSPDQQLQNALVDALNVMDGAGHATRAQVGARSQLDVQWSVRDLTVHNGEQQAVCKLRIVILDARTHTVLHSETVTASRSFSGNNSFERARTLAIAMQDAVADTAVVIAKVAGAEG